MSRFFGPIDPQTYAYLLNTKPVLLKWLCSKSRDAPLFLCRLLLTSKLGQRTPNDVQARLRAARAKLHDEREVLRKLQLLKKHKENVCLAGDLEVSF
jgi:hypothetical protein